MPHVRPKVWQEPLGTVQLHQDQGMSKRDERLRFEVASGNLDTIFGYKVKPRKSTWQLRNIKVKPEISPLLGLNKNFKRKNGGEISVKWDALTVSSWLIQLFSLSTCQRVPLEGSLATVPG